MPTHNPRLIAIAFAIGGALLSLAALTGCGAPADTTINFVAMVGDKPFACGQTYKDLGKTKASFQPMDLKLWVHDIRLLDDSGKEVPFKLSSDGKWQTDSAALLDFEDATGECKLAGSAEMRTKLVGSAQPGTYTGIAFKLGLPFKLNHADAFSAAAPLNSTAMYWSWALGYKFFRIDGKVPELKGKPFRFHIGSRGCSANAGEKECDQPNRAEVRLTGFSPDKNQVVLDVAKILQEASIDADTTERFTGCMSTAPNNPQCPPLYTQMGLTYQKPDLSPDKQSAFAVMPLQ